MTASMWDANLAINRTIPTQPSTTIEHRVATFLNLLQLRLSRFGASVV